MRNHTTFSVSDIDRFWSHVSIGSPQECWKWIACKSILGYGRFSFLGRVSFAHRVSWELSYGSIPKGKCVLHHCDNRACVNPSHLFLGTQTENIKDMDSKGRRKSRPLHGESSPNSKITERDVIRIRDEVSRNIPYSKIASEFGISFQSVGKIAYGKTWSHISYYPIRDERYRGKGNIPTKLTAQDVVEIRRLYSNGITRKALAQQFKVTLGNIGCIIRHETWKEKS